MTVPSTMPHLKGFRFAREIVAYVVWAHHRFDMSTADVEELPTGRDVVVSREEIRLWVIGFKQHFAGYVRRDRPTPCDKWHADEVVISIQGVKHWLWLVIDAHGNVLDILVQPRQNTKAAKLSLHSLTARFSKSRVAASDKPPSYIKPIRTLSSDANVRGLLKQLKSRIDTRGSEKRYLAGSSHQGMRKDSPPRMIRLI